MASADVVVETDRKYIDESAIDVIARLGNEHDTVSVDNVTFEETAFRDDELSAAASSRSDLGDIFGALDEDFGDEESRSRFLAAQLQMLEHYGLGVSSEHSDLIEVLDDGAVSSSNHSTGTQTESSRNIPVRSRSDSAFDRIRAMRERARVFSDGDDEIDDDSDDEDGDDLFYRVQIELLRRLGLFEDGDTIPEEDQRPELECEVCLETVRLTPRSCCQKPVCDSCLEQYVETQIVDNGNLQIGCPNPECKSRVFYDEIRNLLRSKPEIRERYDRWVVDLNGEPHRKTCPRCCHITELEPSLLSGRKVAKNGLKVECVECQLDWCFPCQSPWHEGMTCKKFRAGDVLLKHWAKEHHRTGECNAQRCPKCKVYIQRTEGCDHMTCSRCHTEFCYRCGCRRLPALKIFGYPLEDHDLRRSIIGCNNDYKRGKPTQRALARGALFGAKVVGGTVAMPVAIGLAAGAAGLAAGLALIVLPAYGTYRLARKIRNDMKARKEERAAAAAAVAAPAV